MPTDTTETGWVGGTTAKVSEAPVTAPACGLFAQPMFVYMLKHKWNVINEIKTPFVQLYITA